MCCDAPCNKTIFGFDLYSSGIHFREADKVVRGFCTRGNGKIIITGATQYAFVFSENLRRKMKRSFLMYIFIPELVK